MTGTVTVPAAVTPTTPPPGSVRSIVTVDLSWSRTPDMPITPFDWLIMQPAGAPNAPYVETDAHGKFFDWQYAVVDHYNPASPALRSGGTKLALACADGMTNYQGDYCCVLYANNGMTEICRSGTVHVNPPA